MMPCALVLLATLAAPAEEPALAPAPRHQLSLYARSGLGLFLSDARTQGGVGGGFGVRDTLEGRWLLQADLNGLTGLGSVLEARVGVGVQRQGFWRPAALVTFTGLFGDRLTFVLSEQTRPARGPALGAGVTLAPVRFGLGRTQVSLLELSLGTGPEQPGWGVLYGLTVLEVGVAL